MVAYTEKLDPSQGDIDAVLAALVASEQNAGRDAGYQPFSVLLSDAPGGPVTGGLYGYQLFDWTDGAGVRHAYYLESFWQIGAASLVGIGLVLLTPVVVRALNRVDRAAVRGLLAG